MGRGVVAACLAILLCHGLSSGQTPLPGGTSPGDVTAAPPLTATPGAPLAATEPVSAGPVAATTQGGVVGTSQGSADGLHIWAGVEYLLWYVEEGKVRPPLVTNGINANDLAGTIGSSGTRLLLGGGQTFNDEPYSGLRVRVGADLADSGVGVEAIGFVLDQQRTQIAFPSPTANPDVLSIPLRNVNRNSEAVLQVRSPENIDGSILFSTRTNFAGAEVNFGYAVNATVVDWAYIGYRHLNLTEAMFMNTEILALRDDRIPFLGVNQPAGTAGQIRDAFGTSNSFNGGQFGLVKRLAYRNVSLDMRGSLAFGETRQRLSIRGGSGIGARAADGSVTLTGVAQGGVFAQASNIGDYTTNQFSVVPEVGASVYVRLLDGVMGFVGYNFLFWTNVIRPGDQIDRNIELQQTPFSLQYTGIPTGQPALTSKRSDLAVHGLNAGLAIQF